MRWAVSDTAMLVPGEQWGAPTESGDSVRVRDESALSPAPGQIIAAESLRTPVPGTFVAVDVGNLLNGPVATFGDRLFQLLQRRVPALEQQLRGDAALKSVLYSDRYLRSPLSVRLLAEVLRWLSNAKGGLSAASSVCVRSTFEDSSGYMGLTGNWPSASLQKEVSELVLTRSSKGAPRVEVLRKRDLPHHRFLQLEWTDGKGAEIRFDQGLSGMHAARRAVAFDTARVAARQATELFRLVVDIEPGPAGSAPIYVAAPR
jgi:DEAD/DEAH box helicase domain-containing protein